MVIKVVPAKRVRSIRWMKLSVSPSMFAAEERTLQNKKE